MDSASTSASAVTAPAPLDDIDRRIVDALQRQGRMTFDELEKWLVLMFARYHRDLHSGIGTTPLTKWREGILGTKKQPGRGLPPTSLACWRRPPACRG